MMMLMAVEAAEALPNLGPVSIDDVPVALHSTGWLAWPVTAVANDLEREPFLAENGRWSF